MPELPDVEVFKRYLDATALHQRIEGVRVESPILLSDTSPQGLGRALKGKTFHATRRHGKYLLVAADHRNWLVLHFGMTGSLKYFEDGQDMPDHVQCLFAFDNGYSLAYVASRKLGRIALTDTPETLVHDRHLGPDALDLGQGKFLELVGQHRGAVKSWLMNQEIMAGLGNVYSDEILFQAGIYPRRSISDLDQDTRATLHRTLQAVLKAAIKAKADPERMPAKFLLPHREEGGHCPKCGSS